MKKQWPVIRTLLFITIGLLNTVFIRPEDIGTWKNYLGYVILIIGIIDAVVLIRKYLREKGNV